jgi:hypothetical protein
LRIDNFREINSGDYLCISNSSLVKNIYSTIRLSLVSTTPKSPIKMQFNVPTRRINVNKEDNIRPVVVSTIKPDILSNNNVAIVKIQTSTNNHNILNNLPQQTNVNNNNNNEIVFSLNKNSIHSTSKTSSMSTTTTTTTTTRTTQTTSSITTKESNEDLIKNDDNYFEYCDNSEPYMKCYHGGKCFKTKKYNINHPLFTQFCM